MKAEIKFYWRLFLRRLPWMLPIVILCTTLGVVQAVRLPAIYETEARLLQVPCERDGGKVFVSAKDVVFVRADAHYTQVYTQDERLFCVWSVTEATKRLSPLGFLQTHRSYLVNPEHVVRFERTKDSGKCVFGGPETPPAPVSRSKLKVIQDALASQVGAIRAT